jgi:cytochrome c-type biogenesis protein CcmF
VRRRQTGSDPVTSLIGLILMKRRKYGGYFVHLGVAIMFFGFAGKAYDHMIDRTVEKPGIPTKDGKGPSSFAFPHFKGPFSESDYTFTYERLIQTSDDHKDAVTTQVGIYDKGERIATVYPAKWKYHQEPRCGDPQETTEVTIKVRVSEDVYLVLTGYNVDTQEANFRVFINPLIVWVWIGFLMLALGTLVCLIPQAVVESVSPRPKTKLGRAADVGVVIALVFGIVFGFASQAHAAPPPTSTGEHVPAGMGMGNSGGGFAAQNRPTTPVGEKAMKELICPCGCARQSIFHCDCESAARLRGKVMTVLAEVGDNEDGYQKVLDAFVAEYGEKVLATPKSNFPWLFPSIAALGGLGLLVFAGRRWMRRKPEASDKPAGQPAEDKYVDQLDDELAGTDE